MNNTMCTKLLINEWFILIDWNTFTTFWMIKKKIFAQTTGFILWIKSKNFYVTEFFLVLCLTNCLFKNQ